MVVGPASVAHRTLVLLAFLVMATPSLAPAAQAITVPAVDTGATTGVTKTANSVTSTAKTAEQNALLTAQRDLAMAVDRLAELEAQANDLLDQLTGPEATWRGAVHELPEQVRSALSDAQTVLDAARAAADPRPYLALLDGLLDDAAAVQDQLAAALDDVAATATTAAGSATSASPVPLPALPAASSPVGPPRDATEHHHVDATHDSPEDALPNDLLDDPLHRAAFLADRSWALTGAPITATSRSLPRQGLVALEWAYDTDRVTGTGWLGGSDRASANANVLSLSTYDGATDGRISLQPLHAGLHHLTLTATWSDGDGVHRDRATTPVYVEDPAIATFATLPSPSIWTASLASDLTSGSASALLSDGRAAAVAGLDGLLYPDRPTVLLLSDFADDTTPPAGIAAPTQDALQALADTVAEFDPQRGLGNLHAQGTTDYGADLTHYGGALASSLVASGAANVVMASAIDSHTGSLDRAAIRNALIWAKASGQVDAVLWGLPATAYLPGVLVDSARPNLNFQATPMLPLPADGPLPAAASDWHDAPSMVPGTESVLTELLQLGFADDHGTTGSGLLGRLHENLDLVYDRYKPLVEGVYNDLRFDQDLQQMILDLGKQGIPTVVPAEECPALASTYMTVLGVGHLLGTLTVASGTKDDGVDPASCKGPDRRAHGHGSGIALVAEARPAKASPFDALPGGIGVPIAPGLRAYPYVPGSIGAAARVAAKLGELRHHLRDATHPWAAQDLAGMLAAAATPGDAAPWANGAGFVDLDSVPIAVPSAFTRQTDLVLNPFDLQAGRAQGFLQVVLTGPAAATASDELAAWHLDGGTQWRMTDDGRGTRGIEKVAPDTGGYMAVHPTSVQTDTIAPDVTVVTLAVEAKPEAASGGGWLGTPYAPPRDWILPGLYSGRTWISTSTGILQLPLNLGVGTIADVYRFLAPDKPVGDTLVCLALPDLVGDVAGLRHTSHELGLDELCLYVESTDVHGIARFYTPLPLIPYKLISWFDGRFSTRGGGIGKVYPHIEQDGVSFPLPLNVAGIASFAGTAASSLAGYEAPPPERLPEEGLQLGWAEADATPDNETYPVFLRADLPYPLLYTPINMTFQLAIANNWRYRDNMETDHFVPIPGSRVLDLVDLLAGGRLPGFVKDLAVEAEQTGAAARSAAEDLERSTLATVPTAAVPGLDGSALEGLLGQGVLKALPANLGAGGGSCAWGYGHATSPALTPAMQASLADPAHGGLSASQFLQTLARPALDRDAKDPNQFAWPDTLVMRSHPTLDSLLTLGVALPICTAVYPFNVPQPNYYPTSVVHSFNLKMDHTILIVCIAAGMDTVCWIILPDESGLLRIVPWDLESRLKDILKEAGGLVGFGVEPVPLGGVPKVGDIANLTHLPHIGIGLPGDVNLRTAGDGGKVTLATDLVTAHADSGIITYTAIPLAVADTGLLDPLVGILTQNGIDLAELAKQARIAQGVPGLGTAINVTADVPGLVRDSIQDLLGIESLVAISRPTFDLNAWWWDDSFFDAPIFENLLLPRSTTTDCERRWHVATDPVAMAGVHWPADAADPTCLRDGAEPILHSGSVATANGAFDLGEDWWWRTFPNIDRRLFERGMRYWDNRTLVPDLGRMKADGYPWDQPEMFELTIEQYDDEQVTSVTPNQNHIHASGGHNAHDFVDAAQHCTRQDVRDVHTGDSLLDANGEYCYEGLLAYEEGSGYLFHDDTDGSGIYDPDMGLGGVDAKLLPLLDLAGAPTALNPVVWSLGVDWGTQHLTTPGLVENATGHDPRELAWWSRGVSFTANRTIYSDHFTNATFLLGVHDKPCEELMQFSHVPFADRAPRWQTTCPLQPGPDAVAAHDADSTVPLGFVPAGFGGTDQPAHWDWVPRKMDLQNGLPLTGPTVDGWVDATGPTLAPWLADKVPAGNGWYAYEGIQCRRERWMGWTPDAPAGTREQTIAAFYVQQAQPVAAVRADPPPAGAADVPGFTPNCGDYDGWTYWVQAGSGFNGGAVSHANHYARNLHPVYANGTFAIDLANWAACRATEAKVLDGWRCDAPDPMAQAWRDLLENANVRSESFTDPTTRHAVATGTRDERMERFWVAQALRTFGLDSRETHVALNPSDPTEPSIVAALAGNDRTERVVSVPLAANPDGWYGTNPDATEWDGLFRNLALRQLDWNLNDPRVQTTNMTLYQDSMESLSFLLRAYLDGDRSELAAWWSNATLKATHDPHRQAEYLAAWPSFANATTTDRNPFWTDVSGRHVPFAELDRPRRNAQYGLTCEGMVFKAECHRFEAILDAGDLTGTRVQGPWVRDRNERGAPLPLDRSAFIPQGSSYSRWNRDHRVPVDLAVDGGLAVDELHALPSTSATCAAGAVDYWLRTAESRQAPDGWTPAPVGPPGSAFATSPGWWHVATDRCTEQPWEAWAALVHFEAGAYRSPSSYPLPPALGMLLLPADDTTLVKTVHAFYAYGETDPNDPTRMARVTVSTRVAPDPTDPTDVGHDSGCWVDRRFMHGMTPHQEFATFDTTFWDNVLRSGFYHNVEPNAHQAWQGVDALGVLDGDDYDASYSEPVPATRFGPWCTATDPGTGAQRLVPARSDREYIQQRLAWGMQGGTRHANRTLLAPAHPFQVGMHHERVQLDVRLVSALLDDLLGKTAVLRDLGLEVPDTSAAFTSVYANVTAAAGNVTAAARAAAADVLAKLPVGVTLGVGTPAPRLDLASPVVPLATVAIADGVNSAELALRQDYRFPAGTQGIYLVSSDGATWHQVSGRLRVGAVEGDGSGRLEALDLTPFVGQTITVGAQILGPGWPAAAWHVTSLHGYGTGVTDGVAAPMAAFPGSLASAQVFDPATHPGQSWASLQGLGPGTVVRVAAPLLVPAGATLTLDRVSLVAGDCGGHACPITVDGTLRMLGGELAPATVAAPSASQVAQGAIVDVRGTLEAAGTTLRGLLGGLHVLGGHVTLSDCWLQDTGILGVASVFGELEVRDCVFVGQTLGVYALGSHVRLDGNLFVRMDRAAVALDDSWGLVRGNGVLHAEKAGLLVKGPLGAQNLAILDNVVRETTTGMASTLAPELRLLALDPLNLTVPQAARTRYQGNDVEFATMEGLVSGLLSSATYVGNDVTHNGIGAVAGWGLGPSPMFRHNTLYANFNGWMDAVRADPPQGTPWFQDGFPLQPFASPVRRGPVPEDGNLFLAAFGGGRDPATWDENYWGPFHVDGSPEGTVPKLVGGVLRSPLGSPPDAPSMAALTAPAYGGGILPDLHNATGALLDPGSAILGLNGADGTTAAVPGLPSLVDAEHVVLGLIRERPFPVDLDVPPGVSAVVLNVTFYDSHLERLLGLLDSQDLVGEPLSTLTALRQWLGHLESDGTPVRSFDVPLQVPAGRHVRTNLTFAGLSEAYADVKVKSFTVDGTWSPARMAAMGAVPVQGSTYRGDGLLTKDVRVSNSVTWPLLPDLTALVHDLAFTAVNATLDTYDQVVGAAGVPLDAGQARAAGVPIVALPDGTLPLNGIPDLLTLAKDQDPVRGIEARVEVGLDAGLDTSQLALGMDKSLALPDLPEGVTLAVEARAMDASNLVSPWVGVRLLTDLHAPTLTLDQECLSDVAGGIPYEAHEWRDAAWAASRRPSGIAKVSVLATPLVTGAGLPGPVRADALAPGDDVAGALAIPPSGLVDGMVYHVRGVAQDRAGNAGHDDLDRLVVDLSPPRIDLGALLGGILADAQAGRPFIGLDDLVNGTLRIRVLVDDVPETANAALRNSCGLLMAVLEMRTAADAPWTPLASFAGSSDSVHADLNADVDVAGAMSGRYLELRVRARDGADHEAVAQTGNLLVDVTLPLPIALPDLPTCIGRSAGNLDVHWGGVDLVPPGGEAASGLASGDLVAVSTGATTTLDHFTATGQASVAKDTSFDPAARLGAGQVLLAVRVEDQARNGQLWTSAAGLDAPHAAMAIAIGDLKVDLADPTFAEAAFRHWEGLTASPLTAVPVNGDVVSVDTLVDDAAGGLYSCGMALVQVLLETADGAVPVDTVPAPAGATSQTVYGRSVNLATHPELDGRVVDLRVHAEDQGGNAADRASPSFLVDLTPPSFTLPSLPTCVGADGLLLSWTTSDPARPGVTYAYTPSGVASSKARLVRAGLDTSTVLASGSTWVPAVGDHGVSAGFRAEATDVAGNAASALFPGSMTVDRSAPTTALGGVQGLELTPAGGGVDSGTIRLRATATDAGCAGALHVWAQRYVDNVANGAPIDLGASPVDWNDPLSTAAAVLHHKVKYDVWAKDAVGNVGTKATTRALDVDYRFPAVDLTSTAAAFGRMTARGTDLGNPYTGAIDLLPGLGNEDGAGLATVVSALTVTGVSGYSSLPITATATHPGAVTMTAAATLDGATAALSGSGPWTYTYGLSTASRNVEHTYVVTVTGSNGLASSVRHRVYIPLEATVQLEDSGTWTATGTGTGDRITTPVVTGPYALRVDATPSQAIDLRRAVANPSPRLAALADVRIERKDATGDLRILDLVEGTSSRATLVLSGATREIVLRTSGGDQATGLVLPLGKYVRVALVLQGTSAEVYADGAYGGQWTVPAAGSGITAVAVGGAGGKAYVDNVQLKVLDLAVRAMQARLPVTATTDFTAVGGVSLTNTVGTGSDKAVKVAAGSSTQYAVATGVAGSSTGHYTLHFRPASLSLTGQVLALEDAGSNAVVTVRVQSNLVRVSDGSGEATLGGPLGTAWHRVDLYLEGSQYVAQLDRDPANVLLLDTSSTGAVARAVTGRGATVEVDELRVSDTTADFDEAGTGTLLDNGWNQVGTVADITQATSLGHWTPNEVDVNSKAAESAYLWADTAKVGPRYVAQASFRPYVATEAPDNQAVLAGLTATGTVLWTVSIVPHGTPGLYDGYELVFKDPSGGSTTVLGTAVGNPWHTVRATVDETARTLTLDVDDATVSTATYALLPHADRIAVGDLSTSTTAPTGNGHGTYDDLSLLPR